MSQLPDGIRDELLVLSVELVAERALQALVGFQGFGVAMQLAQCDRGVLQSDGGGKQLHRGAELRKRRVPLPVLGQLYAAQEALTRLLTGVAVGGGSIRAGVGVGPASSQSETQREAHECSEATDHEGRHPNRRTRWSTC